MATTPLGCQESAPLKRSCPVLARPNQLSPPILSRGEKIGLECDHELRRSLPLEAYTRRWRALLEWGEHRFFTDAKQEGWFDVLVFYARAHPRSVRTVDYWVFYWDAYWSDKPLDRYPSFQRWREAADDYFVESEDK